MATSGDSARGSWDPLVHDTSRRIVPTPQYTNPLAAEIADWLNTCQRTAKALRVYDRNNTMIHQFMDRAMAQLTSIHEKQAEILLTVREDRLRWERDPVLINGDRHDGIPFMLYRNAFRRLTFERGMTRQELLDFLSALTVDFSAFDQTGEDLLTVLWRLKLPHFRYFTIDALSTVASTGGAPSAEESEEIDRIQGDIDGLVARIYGQTQVDDADIVKGVSITRDDLEALKEIREGHEEELEMLDVATARAIADIPKREMAQVKQHLEADDRDALVSRLIDVLLHLLFHDRSSVNTAKLLELVQQLFDSILLAGKVGQATAVVRRLRAAESSEDLQAMHVSRHLLKLLVNETRTVQMLAALNEGKHATAPHEVLDLLRAIGASIGPVLLGVIDSVTSAGNRRLVCELIVELGMPEPALLLDRLQRSSQLVVLDLLTIAQRLPRDELAPILLWAVEHETAKVRSFALGLLRPYPAGVADELVVKALRDPDATVRGAAYRLIGFRKHVSYRAAIEAVFRAEDELWSREAREVMTLMLAYAAVAGDEGVLALERVLNPGFFARSKMTAAQVAAAVALGRIGSPAAREALTRGQRTINSKVREACRRALAREPEPDVPDDILLTPAQGLTVPDLSSLPPVAAGKDRTADMDMSAELLRGNADPLERARFDRDRPKEAAPSVAPQRMSRTPDNVGVVRRATPTVDTIPEKLSRASIKVEPASEPGSRRPSRASSAGMDTVGSGSFPTVPPAEARASSSGARELDLSDDLLLPVEPSPLIEPSPLMGSRSSPPRAGSGSGRSPVPRALTPAPMFAAPPPATTPARGVGAPPPASTPSRGFSAPPSAARLSPPPGGPTPSRGFSAPPPAVTPAMGFAPPRPPPTPPPMPSYLTAAPVAVPAPGQRPLPAGAGSIAPAQAVSFAAPTLSAPPPPVSSWVAPVLVSGPAMPPVSETPVQINLAAPTPPESAPRPPAEVLRVDHPTPGQGTQVPTPHYQPSLDGLSLAAAPTPARGIVNEWSPSARSASVRSAMYGSAAPGPDSGAFVLEPVEAQAWAVPAAPLGELPPLPPIDSMPAWMSPRSSAAGGAPADDLAAWAAAVSAAQSAPPAGAAWATELLPPVPSAPAHAAAAPPPLTAAPPPAMSAPPHALAKPTPVISMPLPDLTPAPAAPPLRPSFAEGLEDLFPRAPVASPVPAPPRSPVPWTSRPPDRSRDLAPLPVTPDSGSHPTWDDAPSDDDE